MNTNRVIISTTHPAAGCAICEQLERDVLDSTKGDTTGVVRVTGPGSVDHQVTYVPADNETMPAPRRMTLHPGTVTITYEQRPGKPFPCHHVDCKACGYTYPAAVKVDAAEKAGIHRRNCPTLGGA